MNGPAFCDRYGGIAQCQGYEVAIMERLQMIQNSNLSIIPPDVEILENFGLSHSFRRGATSTARTRGVDDKTVDLINRWQKFEEARGS